MILGLICSHILNIRGYNLWSHWWLQKMKTPPTSTNSWFQLSSDGYTVLKKDKLAIGPSSRLETYRNLVGWESRSPTRKPQGNVHEWLAWRSGPRCHKEGLWLGGFLAIWDVFKRIRWLQPVTWFLEFSLESWADSSKPTPTPSPSPQTLCTSEASTGSRAFRESSQGRWRTHSIAAVCFRQAWKVRSNSQGQHTCHSSAVLGTSTHPD